MAHKQITAEHLCTNPTPVSGSRCRGCGANAHRIACKTPETLFYLADSAAWCDECYREEFIYPPADHEDWAKIPR